MVLSWLLTLGGKHVIYLPTKESRASCAVSDRFNLTDECGHETQHETKVLQLYRMPEINL